jgi:drug/metabolite transporter (DMT)-like permease
MNNSTKKGILFAFVTAVISGFSIFYNKIVVTGSLDPLIFNILKNGGVAIILSFLLLSTKRIPTLVKLSRNQWLKLLLIAFVGGSIPFVLFFTGLKNASAINATIIQKSMFIWVAALAIPFLGEKLSVWQILGVMLVAWSNLFIGGFSGFTWSGGELMIVAATMLWSIEIIITKITLKGTDNLIVSWGRMFIGGIILIGIAILQGKVALFSTVTTIQLVGIAGSIALLAGYVTSWHKALKLAPAGVVTSVLILATPITNMLSAIFITHVFPQPQIINVAVTVVGLVCINFLTKNFPKQPSASGNVN